jgi:hypothetical protein
VTHFNHLFQELKWTNAEKQRQLDDAIKFLKTQMGKDVNRTSRENIPINLVTNLFPADDEAEYARAFVPGIASLSSLGLILLNFFCP